MSIMHSLRRSQQIPETHFFLEETQFQFLLGFWGRRIWTFSEKKFRTVQTVFEVSSGKIWGKMFFFGVVKNLHNCLDCDGNTFKNSAKNSLLSSPNCLVRVQTKDLNEVTFFRSFQFWFFFQKLSGKYPAVLSKTNSTRREERMKHEVLNGSSLIA